MLVLVGAARGGDPAPARRRPARRLGGERRRRAAPGSGSGAALRPGRRRADVPHGALARAAAVPRAVPGGVAGVRARAAGSGGAGGGRRRGVGDPGGDGRARRAADHVAAGRARPDRRAPLSRLRVARSRRHLVPRRHDRRRPHDRGGAGARHRPPPARGRPADRRRPPTSLFTLLARSHRLAVEEPITDVCPPDLCSEERPGMGRRLRTLFADLRVVSSHLLLPEDLRGGLPPIDRDYEGFAGEGTVAPGATIEQRRAFIDEVFRRLGEDDPRERFASITRAAGRRGSRPPFAVPAHQPPARAVALPGRRPPVRRARPVDPRPRRGSVDRAAVAGRPGVRPPPAAGAVRRPAAGRAARAPAHDRHLRPGARGRHRRPRRELPGRRPPAHADAHQPPRRRQRPAVHQGAAPASRAVCEGGAVRTIDVLPTIARELGIRLAGRRRRAGRRARRRSRDRDRHARQLGGRHDADLRHGRCASAPSGVAASERCWARRVTTRTPSGRGPSWSGRGPWRGAPSDGRVRLASGAPWVSGRVTGLPEGAELAVAVDGRVEATTRTWRRGRFGTLAARTSGPGHVLEVGRDGELRPLAAV